MVRPYLAGTHRTKYRRADIHPGGRGSRYPPRPMTGVYRKGILSEPLDLDDPRSGRAKVFPKVDAVPGLEIEQRGSGRRGVVVSVAKGFVTMRDRNGRDSQQRMIEGGFMVKGKQVTLVPARPKPGPHTSAPTRTASGSVAIANAPARVARASRILVEGVHDAELVEHVWGDDLRVEGVAVELLDGADHLNDVIARFQPRPGRRLGVLLDHLVDGSKESRIAASVTSPDVLVTGHDFVDVWAAIKPSVIGVRAWPDVPRGEPWKEGVCRRLGVGDPPAFWKKLRNSVSGYADLDPSLVGAVEQLIDFVTDPG